MIKIGTTFSGIGAPEQALKNLGISHIIKWACDIDKHAKQTYFANHTCEKWHDDITKINIDELEYVDLYVFGFPCQAYSSQGLRGGLEDHRGKLIYYSLKILQEKQPKYFIAENVRGLLTHDNGNTFRIIKESLESTGYNITFKLLNSKDYGIPHNRPRVYIIGIRKDLNRNFIFGEHPEINIELKDILEPNPDNKFFMTNHQINYCQHPKFNSDKVVVNPKIAKCLRTGARSYYKLNGIYRFLTNIEQKRLQGFPDDFKMPVSDTQIRRQMGNTMTVTVLEQIFKQLAI